MRFIALRNFRNPRRAIVLEKGLHPDHVHKGAIFAIGEDSLFQDEKAGYKKLNKEQTLLVGQLNYANCLGNAAKPEVVKAVEAELAAEKAAAEATAAMNKRAGETRRAEVR